MKSKVGTKVSQSLSLRIIFLYSSFTFCLIILLTTLTYFLFVDVLKKKEKSMLDDSIEYMVKDLDARMKDINEEFIGNFDNERFMELYRSSVDSKGQKGTASQLLANEYKEYFSEIQMRNSDLIESIVMITGDGQVYGNTYSPPLNAIQFQASRYYQTVMDQKNKILYDNTYVLDDTFPIMRAFYYEVDNQNKGSRLNVGYRSERNEDYATLLYIVKKNYFRKFMEKEAKRRQVAFVIMDDQGNTVAEGGKVNETAASVTKVQIMEADNQYKDTYETRISGQRYVIHYRSMEYTGWKLIYLYDQKLLYMEADKIRYLAYAVFGVAIVAVVLIAHAFSKSIVQPIHQLSESMDQALENDLLVEFRPKYQDEIAELGETFRTMMGKIIQLVSDIRQVEKLKREAQMNALQAQINPHFLYNTLDTVYWLAKMDGNEKISAMIADLAMFFRLSLNKGEDITTVEREVEHVSTYLRIQKVRSADAFDYEIQLEESVKKWRIPKLILQPIVENSIIHGFEGIEYPGRIVVRVRRDGDTLIFEVEDNGIGMSDEVMEQIMSGEVAEHTKSGYAIKNVRERIALYAGETVQLVYGRNEEQGTKVTITFPIEKDK